MLKLIDFEKYVNEKIQIFVSEWFLEKHGFNRNPKALDGYYEIHTEKAILFKIHPIILAYHKPEFNRYRDNGLWIPKSLISKIVKNEQKSIDFTLKEIEQLDGD